MRRGSAARRHTAPAADVLVRDEAHGLHDGMAGAELLRPGGSSPHPRARAPACTCSAAVAVHHIDIVGLEPIGPWRITCWSSGRPARGCSTFGRSEFIRLPWPAAARMTTESCMTAPSKRALSSSFAGARWPCSWAIGAGELGLRLREISILSRLVDRSASSARCLAASAAASSRSMRPGRSVREHGHRRSAAPPACRRRPRTPARLRTLGLHAHFAGL